MKYDTYYQEFCNEVHKALGSFLFWRMIQNRAYNEKELLDALNRTPLSWIMTRHALQVTLFMTLGRIFDTDGDAFSVDDLLKCCVDEIDIFSKDNLEDRKIAAQNGNKPDWLDEYIADADDIQAQDFQNLRGELSKYRKIFEKNYRPIRHKLFAHNEKEQMGRRDELWQQTNIEELKKILWFLHDLKETLFDAYQNGRSPVLKMRAPDVTFYESDFARLLDQTRNSQPSQPTSR
jgi:hypothetical protein